MTNEGKIDIKDIRILQLEHCIEKFKEYDNKRKEYYSNILRELGELKSYVEELEDTNLLASKCIKQKRELKRLHNIINLKKISEIEVKDITLKKAVDQISVLKKENNSLRKQNNRLLSDISMLVTKLNKYENNKN